MTIFEHALSIERFSTFLKWANGDREAAIGLYTSNVLLSESLHVPLHILEITIRNRINAVLTEAVSSDWFEDERFLRSRNQRKMLQNAKQDMDVTSWRLEPVTIIPALTFGYWAAFLGWEYEELWRSSLHKIARTEDGKYMGRKQFSARLGPIRKLRNRIAHYEPIIHWNLPSAYADMLQLIEWLSPSACLWCRTHCRFETVWAAQGPTLPLHHMPSPKPAP